MFPVTTTPRPRPAAPPAGCGVFRAHPMSDGQLGEGTQVVERSPEDVRKYARRRYALVLAHFAMGVGFIGAMIARGSAALAGQARAIAGPDALLLTTFLYFTGFSLAYLLVSLPLSFYSGHLLEHQFGLSTQTLGRWATRRIKKWLYSFIVAAPLVLIFYAMLRRWPRMWWIPAAAVWIFVTYVLTKFAPRILIPIFYKLETVDDEALSARLSELAAKAGIKLAAVCRIDLSRETKKANAAVVGMGSTRRVVLGDTLLASFSHDEIAAVFAHELGHIVHKDLIKGLVLAGILSAASLYAGSVVLGRSSAALDIKHVYDPETLPILIAVLAAIQLLVLPLEKWYSRRRELESDRYALISTGAREAFISAMRKLGSINLADVRPNKLAEIFLFSHPPISKRIRFAATLDLGAAK